ncbi:alpha/beta hydrolase [Maribacter sp. M208]|uniref:alpha/beta fold hydrolase n=1 Tax=Maribacter huludaoensis TaxID=3030010 RepID=UPI0023EB97D7|nr:alpha/beta hydrolase [Maribacter huludaoensis]MDF4222763.1 alpha/beta hydrolase [Maribacter huludaoensis]
MKNSLFSSIFILIITQTFGQTISEYPFEVKKSGNGNRTIVLIPGFACSGNVWTETKSVYEKDFTCYTLTMAGFADAEPSPNPNFENWKTGIANFISEKNIEKPILIGHSMGGGLAMAIAADYPKLIEKIVVVDALPCLAALTNPNFKHQENIDCSGMVNQITALPKEQFHQMQKMTMPQLIENKEMIETVVNWSIQSDRQTFAEMYCDFSNTDLREKIKGIECPSLILLESNFTSIKPAIKEQFKNLKSADLQYANQGLHFIMYDDKEWYFNQLENFITNN